MNLQRHLNALVFSYSVSTPSESSDTNIEPESQVTTVPETPPENAPVSQES